MGNNKKKFVIASGIILLILIIDQILKIWIKTHMMLGEEYRIADWFIIHFTENPGMAFGMEFGGASGKLILSLFRIVAIGFMGWYLFQSIKKGTNYYFIVALSLIIAGALGNLIDSAFYGLIFEHSSFRVADMFPEAGGYSEFLHGKVVDMFYFPIINGFYPEWVPKIGGQPFTFFKPVFNIADASITTGVFVFILFYKKVIQTK
ncbi:MAG: lipoprotein signal peptidase [Candidatus Delongbacteria bacterium]|jgi:signal peptidase II|nr:lipoprotein signal peptidase [Candidatus Delongbacteria bacterium]